MRIDGPTRDLDPEIDFSEWSWGDFESEFKPIADLVAGVLWDEIIKSVSDTSAYFDLDTDGERPGRSGEVALFVGILDTHRLVIPLSEIEFGPGIFDEDEQAISHVRKEGTKHAVDWQRTIELQEQQLEIVRDWAATIEKQIARTKLEASKEETAQ